MKLFVDDIREPPEGWAGVKTITEAIRFISMYGTGIEAISLDHDISFAVQVEGTYRPFPSPDNFTAVAHYIGMYYTYEYSERHPKITIHSSNPDGCENIKTVLKEYGVESEINMMGPAHRKL